MKTRIYGLSQRPGSPIRYVGKTVTSLNIRLSNHMYRARSGPKKRQIGFQGEKHPMAKLNQKLVRSIRSEYVPYKVPIWRLAKKYSLDYGTVWRVVNHQTFLDGRS